MASVTWLLPAYKMRERSVSNGKSVSFKEFCGMDRRAKVKWITRAKKEHLEQGKGL